MLFDVANQMLPAFTVAVLLGRRTLPMVRRLVRGHWGDNPRCPLDAWCCCSQWLLKLHLNLTMLVNLELVINFDSFDYPANGGTLPHERIDSVLTF